jgi:hypothetical protein
MLKLAVNIAAFGAFVLIAGALTVFLWDALFAPEKYSDAKRYDKPAYSDQQSGDKHPSGAGFAPSRPNPTEETIASYTKWLVIFTGALALATILLFVSGERGVDVARGTAEAAKETADVANRTLAATQRAWMHGEFTSYGDLVFGDAGMKLAIRYKLYNSGNTPATNVKVQPKLLLFKTGGKASDGKIIPQTDAASELLAFRKRNAEASQQMAQGEYLMGETVFPNRPLSGGFSDLGVPKSEIDDPSARGPDGIILPVLLICVTYRFPSDVKSHYTGYIYLVHASDPSSPGGMRQINPDQRLVPSGDVRFLPNPFRSGIAN